MSLQSRCVDVETAGAEEFILLVRCVSGLTDGEFACDLHDRFVARIRLTCTRVQHLRGFA